MRPARLPIPPHPHGFHYNGFPCRILIFSSPVLTRDFSYSLPKRLIARQPADRRDASRLLCLGALGEISDSRFSRLPEHLQGGDLLVLNDTRVIPARLFAKKETGGRVEIMLERILNARGLLVQLRAGKTPRPGALLWLDEETCLKVAGRRGELFLLDYEGREPLPELLNRLGQTPLPPYLDRAAEALDKARYQTVFAKRPGAVAAPTAGLHFTRGLLNTLQARGIDHVFLTLHVGAGTFQPVRVEEITRHKMHSESMALSAETARRINETRANGGRIVAVGTTVVKALESAAGSGRLKPCAGGTDLFIYPGFKFKVADLLLSNFHLPRSTLLMLVSAFAGRAAVLNAYRHAVEAEYRFYSYGDAMLLHRKDAV